MPRFLTLILLAGAIPARAQDNSPEAYRLDRIATQKLNDAAAAKLKARPAPPPTAPVSSKAVAPPPATPGEQALREKEAEAIADWRARVAACEHGRKDACRSY